MSLGSPATPRLDLTGSAPAKPAVTPAAAWHEPPPAVETAIEDYLRLTAAGFLRATADLDPGALAHAIRAACAAGWGTFIDPSPTAARRLATHLHEISLFAISARAPTPFEAAQNWRAIARALTQGDAE